MEPLNLSRPLVVDLDGTLICTDMLHETALTSVKNNPFHFFSILYWLCQSKAILKQKLADISKIEPSILPYNLELISWLRIQKDKGRKLILCTASNQKIAQKINEHLALFDQVIASDHANNLAGTNKAEVLNAQFGQKGFDYIGNSAADLAVWANAKQGIVVNAPSHIAQKAKKLCDVELVIGRKHKLINSEWLKALRIHQWLKNLLLFVPMLAAHQVNNATQWLLLTLAFFAFGCCASAVYVLNDLLDLQTDRQHSHKSRRPFASGSIPVWQGIVIIPFLLGASVLLSNLIDIKFLLCLTIYFTATCLYSFWLKRLVLIDCITLALLYLLRIVAGSVATENKLSFWILAFSIFLFLSLAFVKRFAELSAMISSGKARSAGRGYTVSDTSIIQSLGITSGYAAVGVLALYINSEAVIKLYKFPEVVWGTVPLLIFWISWIWLQASRNKMHEDPLIFAVKDPVSWMSAFAFAAVLILGCLLSPW